MAYSSDAPSLRWLAITPHDSTDLPAGCRAVYVGTGGDVAAVGDDDTAVTFAAVPGGTILPIAAKRINSTNTDADDLVALY